MSLGQGGTDAHVGGAVAVAHVRHRRQPRHARVAIDLEALDQLAPVRLSGRRETGAHQEQPGVRVVGAELPPGRQQHVVTLDASALVNQPPGRIDVGDHDGDERVLLDAEFGARLGPHLPPVG